jgi:hypothetical protein
MASDSDVFYGNDSITDEVIFDGCNDEMDIIEMIEDSVILVCCRPMTKMASDGFYGDNSIIILMK